MSHKRVLKHVASVVSVVYLFTNVAFAHSPQTSVWKDRKNSYQVASAAGLAPLNPLFKNSSSILPSLHPINKKKYDARIVSNLPDQFFAHVNIKDVFQSKKNMGTSVVLVEDVHQNLEAQTHISAAIRSFGSATKTSPVLVALEGAAGGFVYDEFRALSAPAITTISDSFLKTSDISGPSHAGYMSAADRTTNLLFWGVDDRAAYAQNVQAYRDSSKIKTQSLETLDATRRELERQKSSLYSSKLKAFDHIVENYRSGKLSLQGYVTALARTNEPTSLTFETFQQALEMESKIDFNAVEAERRAVIEKLVRTLQEKDLNQLIALSVGYQEGTVTFGDYYSELRRICDRAGVNLAQTPQFNNYIRYVLLADGVDANQLFQELSSLESRVYARLANNKEQHDLVAASRHLYLSEELMQFGLTPDQWAEYQITKIQDPRTNLNSFENFYKAADVRSQTMVKEALAKAKSAKASTVVLVAGGFHTEELSALLKRQNVSFVVATPKITKIDANSGSLYLSVFDREKTPLDEIFAGSKLYVAPPVAGAETPLGVSGATSGQTLAIMATVIDRAQKIVPLDGVKLLASIERIVRSLVVSEKEGAVTALVTGRDGKKVMLAYTKTGSAGLSEKDLDGWKALQVRELSDGVRFTVYAPEVSRGKFAPLAALRALFSKISMSSFTGIRTAVIGAGSVLFLALTSPAQTVLMIADQNKNYVASWFLVVVLVVGVVYLLSRRSRPAAKSEQIVETKPMTSGPRAIIPVYEPMDRFLASMGLRKDGQVTKENRGTGAKVHAVDSQGRPVTVYSDRNTQTGEQTNFRVVSRDGGAPLDVVVDGTLNQKADPNSDDDDWDQPVLGGEGGFATLATMAAVTLLGSLATSSVVDWNLLTDFKYWGLVIASVLPSFPWSENKRGLWVAAFSALTTGTLLLLGVTSFQMMAIIIGVAMVLAVLIFADKSNGWMASLFMVAALGLSGTASAQGSPSAQESFVTNADSFLIHPLWSVFTGVVLGLVASSVLGKKTLFVNKWVYMAGFAGLSTGLLMSGLVPNLFFGVFSFHVLLISFWIGSLIVGMRAIDKIEKIWPNSRSKANRILFLFAILGPIGAASAQGVSHVNTDITIPNLLSDIWVWASVILAAVITWPLAQLKRGQWIPAISAGLTFFSLSMGLAAPKDTAVILGLAYVILMIFKYTDIHHPVDGGMLLPILAALGLSGTASAQVSVAAPASAPTNGFTAFALVFAAILISYFKMHSGSSSSSFGENAGLASFRNRRWNPGNIALLPYEQNLYRMLTAAGHPQAFMRVEPSTDGRTVKAFVRFSDGTIGFVQADQNPETSELTNLRKIDGTPLPTVETNGPLIDFSNALREAAARGLKLDTSSPAFNDEETEVYVWVTDGKARSLASLSYDAATAKVYGLKIGDQRSVPISSFSHKEGMRMVGGNALWFLIAALGLTATASAQDVGNEKASASLWNANLIYGVLALIGFVAALIWANSARNRANKLRFDQKGQEPAVPLDFVDFTGVTHDAVIMDLILDLQKATVAPNGLTARLPATSNATRMNLVVEVDRDPKTGRASHLRIINSSKGHTSSIVRLTGHSLWFLLSVLGLSGTATAQGPVFSGSYVGHGSSLVIFVLLFVALSAIVLRAFPETKRNVTRGLLFNKSLDLTKDSELVLAFKGALRAVGHPQEFLAVSDHIDGYKKAFVVLADGRREWVQGKWNSQSGVVSDLKFLDGSSLPRVSQQETAIKKGIGLANMKDKNDLRANESDLVSAFKGALRAVGHPQEFLAVSDHIDGYKKAFVVLADGRREWVQGKWNSQSGVVSDLKFLNGRVISNESGFIDRKLPLAITAVLALVGLASAQAASSSAAPLAFAFGQNFSDPFFYLFVVVSAVYIYVSNKVGPTTVAAKRFALRRDIGIFGTTILLVTFGALSSVLMFWTTMALIAILILFPLIGFLRLFYETFFSMSEEEVSTDPGVDTSRFYDQDAASPVSTAETPDAPTSNTVPAADRVQEKIVSDAASSPAIRNSLAQNPEGDAFFRGVTMPLVEAFIQGTVASTVAEVERIKAIEALIADADVNKYFQGKTNENLTTWLHPVYMEDHDWILGLLNTIKTKSTESAAAVKELNDSFFQWALPGTAGIRGTRGRGSNRINKFTVGKFSLGKARFLDTPEFHAWVKKFDGDYDPQKPRAAVIARDPRIGADEIQMRAALLYLAIGGLKRVYVYSDPRSTPQLSHAVQALNADFTNIEEQIVTGDVITASHNPKADVGMKPYDPDGSQVTGAAAEGLLKANESVTPQDMLEGEYDGIPLFGSLEDLKKAYARALENGDVVLIGGKEDPAVDDAFIASQVQESFASNDDGTFDRSVVSLDKFVFYISPLNGVARQAMELFLKVRGIPEEQVVWLQDTPDGEFKDIEGGKPNPELPAAREYALKRALQDAKGRWNAEGKTPVLLWADPDSDRPALAVVRSKTDDRETPRSIESLDDFISFNGNQQLALLADYIVVQLRRYRALQQKLERGDLSAEELQAANAQFAELNRVFASNLPGLFGASTVVSGFLFKEILRQGGIEVFETLVGFKYIGKIIEHFIQDALKKSGVTKRAYLKMSKNQRAILLMSQSSKWNIASGEESLGSTTGDTTHDKNAITGLMWFIEIAGYWKKYGLLLGDRLNLIYEQYGYLSELFPMLQFAQTYTDEYGNTATFSESEANGIIGKGNPANPDVTMLGRLRARVRNGVPNAITEIGGKKIAAILDYNAQEAFDLNGRLLFSATSGHTGFFGDIAKGVYTFVHPWGEALPKENFVKLVFEDGSEVTVRPSGTEPTVKNYILGRGEFKDKAAVDEWVQKKVPAWMKAFVLEIVRERFPNAFPPKPVSFNTVDEKAWENSEKIVFDTNDQKVVVQNLVRERFDVFARRLAESFGRKLLLKDGKTEVLGYTYEIAKDGKKAIVRFMDGSWVYLEFDRVKGSKSSLTVISSDDQADTVALTKRFVTILSAPLPYPAIDNSLPTQDVLPRMLANAAALIGVTLSDLQKSRKLADEAADVYNAHVGGLARIIGGRAIKDVSPTPTKIPTSATAEGKAQHLQSAKAGELGYLIFGAGRATRMKLPHVFDNLGIAGIVEWFLIQFQRFTPTSTEGDVGNNLSYFSQVLENAQNGKISKDQMDGALKDLTMVQRQLLQLWYDTVKLAIENPDAGVSAEDAVKGLRFTVVVNHSNREAVQHQLSALNFPGKIKVMEQPEVGGYIINEDGSLTWKDDAVFPEGHGQPFIAMGQTKGHVFELDNTTKQWTEIDQTLIDVLEKDGVKYFMFAQVNDLHLLGNMASVERWQTARAEMDKGAEFVMEMVANTLLQKGGGTFLNTQGFAEMRDTLAMKRPQLDAVTVPKSLSRMFYFGQLSALRKVDWNSIPGYLNIRESNGQVVFTRELYSGDASSALQGRTIEQEGVAINTFKDRGRANVAQDAYHKQNKQNGFIDFVQKTLKIVPVVIAALFVTSQSGFAYAPELSRITQSVSSAGNGFMGWALALVVIATGLSILKMTSKVQSSKTNISFEAEVAYLSGIVKQNEGKDRSELVDALVRTAPSGSVFNSSPSVMDDLVYSGRFLFNAQNESTRSRSLGLAVSYLQQVKGGKAVKEFSVIYDQTLKGRSERRFADVIQIGQVVRPNDMSTINTDLANLRHAVLRAKENNQNGIAHDVVAVVHPDMGVNIRAEVAGILRGLPNNTGMVNILKTEQASALSYATVLKRALKAKSTDLAVVRDLVADNVDGIVFRTFDRRPGQFYAEGRLAAVWVLIQHLTHVGWAITPIEDALKGDLAAKIAA